MKYVEWFKRSIWLEGVSGASAIRTMMVLGFLLRIIPVAIWLSWPCVRDECTYLHLSDRILDGQGMTASNGWIWAPGYPFLVAIHEAITGYGAAIKTTQSILSVGIMALLYHVAKGFVERTSVDDDSLYLGERVAKITVFLYAFSPTQIFFAQSLWSECIYGGLLLLAVWYFHRSLGDVSAESKGDPQDGLKTVVMTGVLVGICVLFRGVATYMLPIFAFSLMWMRWFQVTMWTRSTVLVLATLLTVAPYSLYATEKFGSFMISDRTLGQMMWLGNNDFEPIAFDWGNGPLSTLAYERHTEDGRDPCAIRSRPVERDQCQTEAGIAWVKAHPAEFVARIPLRIAQMMNPHSFLTRHLRWGNMQGLPRWVDESIVLVNVIWNLVVLWGGTVGLVLYGRGSRGLLVSGIWLYHIAAISLLAGLTRYRVPLEPLLMIYVAWFIAVWGLNWKQASLLRKGMACIVCSLVVFFTMWFFPTGWVEWRHW